MISLKKIAFEDQNNHMYREYKKSPHPLIIIAIITKNYKTIMQS